MNLQQVSKRTDAFFTNVPNKSTKPSQTNQPNQAKQINQTKAKQINQTKPNKLTKPSQTNQPNQAKQILAGWFKTFVCLVLHRAAIDLRYHHGRRKQRNKRNPLPPTADAGWQHETGQGQSKRRNWRIPLRPTADAGWQHETGWTQAQESTLGSKQAPKRSRHGTLRQEDCGQLNGLNGLV